MAVLLLGFLLLPLTVLAAIQEDCGLTGTAGVPVPCNPGFFSFAPAGRSTATGLIFSIVNILLLVAGILSVLFLIIGGIRYVTAAGSEERSEQAKNNIKHAITGVIIIILSFAIIRVIANALIFGPLGT